MKKKFLHQNWFFSGEKTNGLRPAIVPGCVHTDLADNGITGDYFWRDENKNCQWIENCDWDYFCTFDAEPYEDVSLVFEGLDTYSEITLNGTVLGKTDNMFIPHRFPVGHLLREKQNELKVHFFSPIRAVEGKPVLKGSFTTERLHTRRMQCTYRWDWVDRFVTCGIFRPVYLTYANGIDVEGVLIHTENSDRFGAQIYTEFEFSHFEKGAVAHVEILDPAGKIVDYTDFFADRERFVRRFDIPNPELWYPNGYGKQPLYRLTVTVGENRLEENFGIRTIKVIQQKDREGSEYWNKSMESVRDEAVNRYIQSECSCGFQVVVNGIKIFCQGGNWVPCEPFPSAEKDDKICNLIRLAKEMGANFLRVWGGGIFEKKAFYDACDREGILVAQDFLMACGHYPEKEAWFLDALRRESEFAARYLRNHPCLAWYHGDNENAVMGSDVLEDFTGRDSALSGIFPNIHRHDPFHLFLPSSPYGGDRYASLTSGTCHTTNHIIRIMRHWEENGYADYPDYLEHFVGRFISEDATLGAISRPSILKFMTEDDLLRDEKEDIWLYHSKGNEALQKEIFASMSDFARGVLGDFQDGEDRYFKYKYLQYDWLRNQLEHARSNLGYCNGDVFWMFNDCWPAASGWSTVDYYGLPKAAFYAFKRASAPLIASFRTKEDDFFLAVSNTRDQDVQFSGTVILLDPENSFQVLSSFPLKETVPAYSVKRASLPQRENRKLLYVCEITSSFGKSRSFFREGKPRIVPSQAELRILEQTERSITLHADTYLHAVELEGDFVFEDNFFQMLPKETKTISFRPIEGSNGSPIRLCSYTLLP